MWPRSWNSRSFCRTTVWPRWRSGRGRVQAELHAQRPALGQALLERPVRANLDGVASEELTRDFPSDPMLESEAWPGLVRPPLTARRLPVAESLRLRDAGQHLYMSDHERTSTTIPAEPPSQDGTVVEFPRTREARSAGGCACGAAAGARSASRSASCASWSCSSASACSRSSRPLFGMFMAVASDLPPIDPLEKPVDGRRRSSTAAASQIGTLTGNERRIYLPRERDRAGDEARDHRDRGPPLLHQQRRRPARHRARRRPGRRRPARPSRAPRRSRSSS